MNNFFNSIEEISIRLLLQLYILDGYPKTSDYISCLDYISLYSSTFGIGDYDLHGNNPYRLSELTSRINLGNKALKILTFKGLCHAVFKNGEFYFYISDNGRLAASSIESDFSKEYINFAINVGEYFYNNSDIEILRFITNKSIKEVGDNNEK